MVLQRIILMVSVHELLALFSDQNSDSHDPDLFSCDPAAICDPCCCLPAGADSLARKVFEHESDVVSIKSEGRVAGGEEN